MPFLGSTRAKIAFAAGAPLLTPLWKLTVLPQTLAGSKRVASRLGREKSGSGGKRMDIREPGKGHQRGREGGEKREDRMGLHPLFQIPGCASWMLKCTLGRTERTLA